MSGWRISFPNGRRGHSATKTTPVIANRACLTEVGSIVCHGPVDDPKGGWGLSIFSAKDQTEVERLTAADPIILDDVGARYESSDETTSDEGSELSKPSAAEHARHR